ncbi:hypothetical protein [Citrobacter koseri]|uniref:gp53-like domain-containing protein n=2 Tax=Citrobacter koseri TaxID=545 RepID=UPI0018612C2D|nr:hypothetical protein [Citrobacter koseri]BCL49793.1 hypothetical protein MPUCK001_36110 [Citrobacter koseri]
MKNLIPPINTPDNLFHDGNPVTGELGTLVTAEWLNNYQGATRDLQSELLSILAEANINPESSALQLLTAIRALTLSRSNPFGDIKNDGAAAISKALENLGLGEAAKRNVGTGANQIPDMSSFISSSGESGYQRLPGGKLIVWGRATVSLSSNTVTLNASFNNTDYRVAVVDTGMGCVPYGASPLSGSTFNLHRAGRAYDSSGTLQTITGASALTYIAIGN